MKQAFSVYSEWNTILMQVNISKFGCKQMWDLIRQKQTNLIWDSGDCRCYKLWRGRRKLTASRAHVTILIGSSGKEVVMWWFKREAARVMLQYQLHWSLSSVLRSPEAETNDRTYPRHDELSSQILNFSFDFAADVELVAVQGDTLQVGQQVLFAGGVRALGETEIMGHRCGQQVCGNTIICQRV